MGNPLSDTAGVEAIEAREREDFIATLVLVLANRTLRRPNELAASLQDFTWKIIDAEWLRSC